MSNYYTNDQIGEGDKRNTAFQTTNAVREAISLALKKPQPITYELALDYIGDLSPELHAQITILLANKNENDKVKYYKDLAEYEKQLGNAVEAIDLIKKDLKVLQEKVNNAKENKGLKLELYKLISAREYFMPRKLSEHKLLQHDFYLAEVPFFGKAIYTEDSYKDYRIDSNQYLRLRLLHPDKAEAILGADLIYEQFDLLHNRVRFVHLQYKAWDTKALYLNDKRMEAQLNKMHSYLCDGGLCVGKHGKNYTKKFRLPYCSGFLRPTSNKVNANSKLKTTGYHVPICELGKLKEIDVKITRENIRGKSVSHSIFEESFTSNQLGSRWMSMDELDKFYDKAGLNYLSDTVRIHAQEVVIPTDEEREEEKKKRR